MNETELMNTDGGRGTMDYVEVEVGAKYKDVGFQIRARFSSKAKRRSSSRGRCISSHSRPRCKSSH